MLYSGKKLCCAVCVIALLLACVAPCFQGVAAAGIGLRSKTRDVTPQADIYGLRNLIELSDALDLSQVTAPQSDIDAFQSELAQAKAVEQNAAASASEINAAYNDLAAAYGTLTPIIDPEQVFVLRSGGLVYYDQISVGLLDDYRNVSQQYQCLAYPYEALIRSVRWSSSNPNITVSEDGVVTSLVNSAQYSTITVTVTTYDGREMTNNPALTVSFAKIHASGLTFDAESMTGYLGETGKINYTLAPTVAGYCTANIQDIIWYSTNSEDVSVDSDGTLHFNRVSGPEIPAAVIIATAADGGYSAQCWIYVDYNRKTMQAKIDEASQLDQTLYTAESWQRMTSALTQAIAVNEKDFYSTSSQAEIDNAATALSNALQDLEPLATIDSIVITHDGSPAAKYNSVTVKTLANYASQSFSLGFSVTPADAAYQSVTWTSSDSKMSVDQNGTVSPTGNNAVASKITVTVTDYNGRQFSDWVYVSFVKVKTTGVTLSSSSLSMTPGSTSTLTCEVQPKGTYGIGAASISTVIWESSDPQVATVNDGTVTALDGGLVTISCITADGGFTATCTVGVSVDKTELNRALFNAAGIIGTPYTPESFAALQDAIAEGTAVYENEYAKIAEVNAARDAVNAAIDALVIRPADYTTLYQLISMYEVLTPELYTPESYEAVRQAVSNVVYGLPYSEQERVDAMAQAVSSAIAQLEVRTAPHLTPAPGSGAVVDETNHLIYGVQPGAADVLQLFTSTEDSTLVFAPAANGSGTGSTVTLIDRYDEVADTFTLVIFGDVDGDGWYNGMDAFIVSLVTAGLLSEDDLGEAAKLAADCDHDGTIDNDDFDLLERAGLLLAEVDQTSAQNGSIQTNSAYVEYLSLIDQSVETEALEDDLLMDRISSEIDKPTQNEEEDQNVASSWFTKLFQMFEKCISFVMSIFFISK